MTTKKREIERINVWVTKRMCQELLKVMSDKHRMIDYITIKNPDMVPKNKHSKWLWFDATGTSQNIGTN
jgi:hypothetical protein